MLAHDLRLGIRNLRLRAGFTAAAVLTLALGIGGLVVAFSLVDAALLRPLPYAAPERLVMVWETMGDWKTRWAAPANFLDWRRDGRSWEALAAWSTAALTLVGEGEPERLRAGVVSANLLDLVGVRPALGRGFAADEDGPGETRVTVLTHGLWQRRFGSDPALVGRAIELDGEGHVVIGVLPATFRLPQESVDLLVLGGEGVPFRWPFGGDPRAVRDSHLLTVLGRLAPGVHLAQAQEEMEAIAARLAEQYPDTNGGLGVNLVPLHEQVVGPARLPLLLILGAAGLVLLIACANVAHLLLARGSYRDRELAVRAALGAGRLHLARQLLVEDLLLALASGALAVALAAAAVELLPSLVPGKVPRLAEMRLDLRVLGFAGLASLVTVAVFGLLPARRAARPSLQPLLAEAAGRTGPGRSSRRAGRLLVVAEVAATQVLLAGAGLLLTSFVRLAAVDPGFDSEGTLTFRLELPATRYSEAHRVDAFQHDLLARLEALPGVEAAGMGQALPVVGRGINRGVFFDDRPAPGPDEDVNAQFQTVDPGYFKALGIPLLAGRQLAATDDAAAPPVVVVNLAMARRYWPGQDPVGKRVGFGVREDPGYWRTVVGVVADARNVSLTAPALPEVFEPYRQNGEPWRSLSVALRAAAEPGALAPEVRRVVRELDPGLALFQLETLDEALDAHRAQPRFLALLAGAVSALALALAVVGLYGVIAYGVAERRAEVGVRMALGARAADVLRLVVGEGVRTALAGLAVGLLGALWLGRALASLLFEVGAVHLPTIAAVSLGILAAAAAASYLPARRAAAVAPLEGLRSRP